MNWKRARLTIPPLLLCCFAVLGCQDGRMYSWGSYQASVRQMYSKQPADFKVGDQILRLTKEVKNSESQHKRVPPGEYAYLGYLYYLSGDTKAARTYFDAERTAFPEGAQFMDRLIVRLP